jgi:hypothetical protein
LVSKLRRTFSLAIALVGDVQHLDLQRYARFAGDLHQLCDLRRDLDARDHRVPAFRQRQGCALAETCRRACNHDPLCHRCLLSVLCFRSL